MPQNLSSFKNNSENSNSMPHHHFLLKNNSENLRNMLHHLMPRHISLFKNNSKNLRKLPHISPLKIIKKNSSKIYYNSLRVINGKKIQHVSMPCHMMSRHLSHLKNNSENSIKIFFS
jgi:hypothetical protein